MQDVRLVQLGPEILQMLKFLGVVGFLIFSAAMMFVVAASIKYLFWGR